MLKTRLALVLICALMPVLSVEDSAPSPDWFSKVREAVVAGEYGFSNAGEDRWSAPNRSQNLRILLSRNGLSVQPREEVASPWALELQVEGYGPIQRIEAVPYVSHGRGMALQREGLDEIVLNTGDRCLRFSTPASRYRP
jgi:hypothetical protein